MENPKPNDIQIIRFKAQINGASDNIHNCSKQRMNSKKGTVCELIIMDIMGYLKKTTRK